VCCLSRVNTVKSCIYVHCFVNLSIGCRYLERVIYAKHFATVVRNHRIYCIGADEVNSCSGSLGEERSVLIGVEPSIFVRPVRY
jgi:hypothetical protein